MSKLLPHVRRLASRQAERKANIAAKPRPPAEYRPVDGRVRFNRIPTPAEIEAIPYIPVVEFELSDKETATLRRRLYAINRDGVVRYRTLREGNITLVWRIA
jgi:hypothetical protein